MQALLQSSECKLCSNFAASTKYPQMATIHFRGTRQDVSRIVQQLAAILSGRARDDLGIARGFMLTMGFAALSDIKDAFVTKADGGTDEMGIRWPQLSPATIANRRVGPGDKKPGFSKGDTSGQELAKVQQVLLVRNRQRIRKREEKKAFKRLSLSLPDNEARRRARIVGGMKATQLTGKTKIQTLGGRDVKILRDTGVLLNSLSPGELSGRGSAVTHTKPGGEGGDEQVFELLSDGIMVGTNVAYASTHQNGDQSRNIPARPFLPDATHPVPPVWWDRWVSLANKALVVSAELLFRRAA